MRKPLTLLAALMISVSSFAQGAATKTANPKHSGWVINGGVSMGTSDITADDLDDDATNPVFSISPTVNAGYMFNPHVGIFTGLSLTSYGFKSPMTDDMGGTFSGKFMNTYLEVPVFVRLITSKPNKIGFIADLGIAPGFLTGAKVKLSAFGQNLEVSTKDAMTQTSVATLVFLGVKIPVHPMINIMAGFDSQYCLTKMFEDAETGRLYRGGLKVVAAVRLEKH